MSVEHEKNRKNELSVFHNIIGKFEFILGSNWGVKFLLKNT